MPSSSSSSSSTAHARGPDLESGPSDESNLITSPLPSFTFSSLSLSLPSQTILHPTSGHLLPGQILAIIGPSGSGKTTLLSLLSRRPLPPSATSTGTIHPATPLSTYQNITRYVEQDDALIGSLTVRETLHFAAKLSGGQGLFKSKKERAERVEHLIDAFGLRAQADVIVGTPIRKGLSGGQKRRLGVASQLITGPAVLFLDEPTSGLDAVAGWEVVNHLRRVARKERLIVIASIHQPSSATFDLFDKVLLLSKGKTHYFGDVSGVTEHYEGLGVQVPMHINIAEWLLQMVSTDFAQDKEGAEKRLEEKSKVWEGSERGRELRRVVEGVERDNGEKGAKLDRVDEEVLVAKGKKPGVLSVVATLVHRSFVKSYRDVVVYGIRLAMYTGLAVMMGTVWLRLPPAQESIQPFINSIFYGSCFLSFMAVAYCPAYLEDYMQYIKEKRNGLYGATEMIVSNFLIGTPYLFLFSVIFSVVCYWLSNFQPTAKAFFTWVFWLFLDLLAAEGLVVFMTSLVPSFVVSLALVAFANGLWMSLNGFMVPPATLNVFYKYVFHYWDYQKYVFEGMMVNEFSERVYSCAKTEDGCHCMWQSDLADQCLIRGQAVLDQYGYETGHMGRDAGIMVAIIFGYRLAAWIVLKLKK
ncbi:ABC transporter G family member 15 [Cladorrhinum sp. PSN332]|nr:ABC transporter G family member 15 [Cladorrhinum sp. PSN332]